MFFLQYLKMGKKNFRGLVIYLDFITEEFALNNLILNFESKFVYKKLLHLKKLVDFVH